MFLYFALFVVPNVRLWTTLVTINVNIIFLLSSSLVLFYIITVPPLSFSFFSLENMLKTKYTNSAFQYTIKYNFYKLIN